MKLKLHALSVSLLYFGLTWMTTAEAALNNVANRPVRNSMSAESPFTGYVGSVAIYVILVGFLVATLLIGGILAVNLGLMSKREEDQIGGRNPSDVAILDTQRRVFPAREAVDEELPFHHKPVKPRRAA